MVAEFDVSGELEEACTCLSEVDPGLRWAAVSEAISDSMERKQKYRDSLGEPLLIPWVIPSLLSYEGYRR